MDQAAKRGSRPLIWVVLAGLAAAAGVGAFLVLGGYDVAADKPHGAVLFWLADTTRLHSIRAHAQGIAPPAGFGAEAQIKEGAAEYAEMCATCHLGPGVEKSEISQGLYPRAPELAKGGALTAAEQFWVIKHGVKMSGMAAWGPTHDDEIIWSIVAFLRKLPSLSEAQYRDLTKDASQAHDEMKAMPGMKN
jgi:mono/diheme cytochrome c family protein